MRTFLVFMLMQFSFLAGMRVHAYFFGEVRLETTQIIPGDKYNQGQQSLNIVIPNRARIGSVGDVYGGARKLDNGEFITDYVMLDVKPPEKEDAMPSWLNPNAVPCQEGRLCKEDGTLIPKQGDGPDKVCNLENTSCVFHFGGRIQDLAPGEER